MSTLIAKNTRDGFLYGSLNVYDNLTKKALILLHKNIMFQSKTVMSYAKEDRLNKAKRTISYFTYGTYLKKPGKYKIKR